MGSNGQDSGYSTSRTEIITSKTVEKARIGSWVSYRYGMESSVSCLGPYVKSKIDIGILLRNAESLDTTQPVELCGVTVNKILRGALSIDGDFGELDPVSRYVDFARTRPIILSYPDEIIWLARKKATSLFADCIAEIAQHQHPEWSEKQRLELGQRMQSLATAHRKSHGFWKAILNERFENETLSRHLIEWTLASANRARAKYLAGMTPIVDPRTPGSLLLSDRYNRAYVRAIDESGRSSTAPHYLYSISLSPFALKADAWSDFLTKLVRIARAEMASGEFDGINLSIRNLKSISQDPGRVRTAKAFVARLADIAADFRIPICWSRAYAAGLVGMDEGVTCATFSLNLSTDDMFLDGIRIGPDAEDHKYGRVLNPWTKERLTRTQVCAMMRSSAGGMPELGLVANHPTPQQLSSTTRYQIEFSKPYNLRAMTLLSNQWQDHIKNGDVRPGREYVQSFETPWCNWGIV